MDRHLIPFLQATIDELGNSVKELNVNEYSFSFSNRKDRDCFVTIFFDSISECVCMNQIYDDSNDHEDGDDLSLEQFVEYIS